MKKKKKPDRELQQLAKKTALLPFNRDGADKSYVMRAVFYFNDYFYKVKQTKQNAFH